MTDEIGLAFDHPIARAQATAQGNCDRISLRDYEVEVEIGAFQLERDALQRLKFNVVVEVAPVTGPVDDDVDRILSYDRVIEAIGIALKAERLNLLETLAERIADRILQEPQAMRIFVRIEKPDRGPFVLGVEIMRQRGDMQESGTQDVKAPAPRFVYLSNEAIASEHLDDWMRAGLALGDPLVICVGLPDEPRPLATDAVLQSRIDLLAVEQNAWRLAARLPQCKVVATRTEMDWATKNELAAIWAPSKIVFDSVEVPDIDPLDGAALAAWFAAELSAKELVVIGADAPHSSTVPVKLITTGQTWT